MPCHCDKIQHPTREAALQHQKALVYKNHLAGQSARSGGLNVYPCPDSPEAWHVGHNDERVPLVYHYTVGYKLDPILQADSLRPRRPDAPTLMPVDEPNPLLWFSWNPVWEQSVTKDPRPSVRRKGSPPTGRAITEMAGRGLLRFGAPASLAKLRWNDYLALNQTHLLHREAMAQRGNPADWLATDQRVPLRECRAFEVYYRGRWVPGADVSDDDFEAYLDDRAEAYAAAFHRMIHKFHTADPDEDARDLLARYHAEDEAEAILLDDYRCSVREESWRRAHVEEIKQWAASLPAPRRRRSRH